MYLNKVIRYFVYLDYLITKVEKLNKVIVKRSYFRTKP